MPGPMPRRLTALLAVVLVALPAFGQEPGDVIVIELDGGSRLRGELVQDGPEAVTLLHPTLGEITIPTGDIAARLDAGARLGPKVEEELPPPPGILGTPLLEGWEKSLAAGFNGKEGDVSEFGVNASFEGDYEDDQRRWRLRSAYFYGTAEGERTKDEGFARLRRDWLLPDNPLFLFAEARGDYNGFSGYRYRTGGFGGAGVLLLGDPGGDGLAASDALDLTARLGAGVSYEWGDVDAYLAEALAAIELKWDPTDGQTVRFNHTYFPDLENLGESRNVTEASYTVKVELSRGLSVKVGVFNEYLSETADESTHNSLTYFGQLQYSF